MSLKKTFFKNTFYNLIGYLFLLIASFISIPILLNSLGDSIFGKYLTLSAVIPLASVLDLGLSQAIIRKLSIEKSIQSKNSIIRSSWHLYIKTSIIVLVASLLLLLILTKNWPDQWILTLLLILIVIINHFNNLLLTIPQALQKFSIFNLKSLIVGTTNTLFSAYLSTIIPSITSIFILQLVSHIVLFIYLLYFANRELSFIPFKGNIDNSCDSELIDFGFKNFVGKISGQFQAQMSKYILAIKLSTQSVTIFTIPQSLIYKAAGAITQGALAFYPLSSSISGRKLQLKKTYINIQLIIFFLALLQLILVETIGLDFMLWWLKDTSLVNQIMPVLKVLSLFFVPLSLTPIPSMVLDSLNYPHITSIFALATMIIELVFILLLIPAFGVTGPAYAALISSLITTPALLYITHKKLSSNT